MKVAINGLGRIGRAFLRLATLRAAELEIMAVNDLGDIENIAYLIKYDSVYGRSPVKVEAKEHYLLLNGRKVAYLSEKEPAVLPWRQLGIDVVIESTGVFESYAAARGHIEAGAKRVIITAPAKDDEGGETVLMGVNEDKLASCAVSSNASCTTNAGSPVIAILDEAIGIEKALLNTAHAYTATQKLVDGPDTRDFRRGRAAAQNIVPSSTGAAVAVTKALTSLKGKFDGIALRVPVVAGSLADITFVSKRPTTVEEVNGALEKAAKEERWKRIFAATREPLVSADIVGNTKAAIADLSLTRVVGGDLVKVMAWYDNEIGYANTLIEHVLKAGEYLRETKRPSN
ncbi:MAG: glyceraldehyde 3-phosphate dehydrogenase NAD-binding domain-containing protein [bacterium]|nr:glyceraldehyde 3-phosphate dehydrogenase NAD-binding domain-containing protein [bacterium]